MSDTLQLVVDSPNAQHIEMGQRAVSVLGTLNYKLKRIGHSLSDFYVEGFRDR